MVFQITSKLIFIATHSLELLPLTQIADITGILGISFLLVWCNATIYTVMKDLIEQRKVRKKGIAVFLMTIGITAAYGMIRIDQIDT